ncbi:PKD domain-containing protein [Haloarcula salina]|uniref:PKD domain-containing protein n=1 Tax=Haloarcula salina TaxID=1429914 RepID=A0AA41KHS6_9EURY|nr:PKD domain-containing protein [Haloarcula salina]MBV0900893.1 PKD domain-containing protein [Haloarcula salina]
MYSLGPRPRTAPPSGGRARWLPVLVALLALPVLAGMVAGPAAAADEDPPEWGNATRGNATTIDVYLYDSGTLDTGTIDAGDFSLTAGRVANVSVASVNASGANRTGARVSLLLERKVDVDNVTVSLSDTASITDEAGNELPDEDVTVTGMDSVVPKYKSFEVRRVSNSTAEIVVEMHEPISALTISVGGAELDTLNVSGFSERVGTTATYTRRYTFPVEGQYSLLLMSAVDRNGNENRFGRQRTFRYDGTAPTVTVEGPTNATVGESVNFSAANSTDDNGIDSVRWYLGSGTILTGERIAVAFATPGTHEVEARVSDPMGNTASVTRVVTVTGGGGGNVTVTRPNATAATARINATGRPQRVEAADGPLVDDENVTLERLVGSFPANESVRVAVRAGPAPASFGASTDSRGVGRFDVDHDAIAEDVTFTFAVDRTAIDAAGGTPASVALFRRQGDWTELETTVASRGPSQVVYRARSPGLSTFVVGVANDTATDEAQPPESTPEAAADAPTADESSQPRETGEPEIAVTNASADPTTVAPGERVVLTVALRNRGTATGDHRVLVAVNGSIVTSRTVTVPPSETRTTAFVPDVSGNATGELTVDGRPVATVTGDSGGGLPIPSLPSLPNPLSLWPDGLVGTVLGALVGLVLTVYGVLKALAIYLGY